MQTPVNIQALARTNMQHPLWLLTKLKFKASLRRLVRSAKTPRGALLLLFTIGFFGLILSSQIALSFTEHETGDFIQSYGPFALFVYTLFLLLTSVGEQAISFSPSEVDQLFPAPLTRRELLTYKLANNVSSTVFLGLLLAFTNRAQYHLWTAGIIGFFLTFSFLQLLGILVSFIGQSVSSRAYTRGRQLVALASIVVLAYAASTALTQWQGDSLFEIPKLIESTMVGRCLLSPFRLFCNVITAERIFPDFLVSASIAITIIGAMLVAIFKLDTDFSDLAIRVSKMRYDRRQKMKRGNVSVSSNKPTKTRIPMLPFLSGSGPLIWRQLLRGLRSMSVAVRLMLCVGTGLSWPIYSQLTKTSEPNQAIPYIVWGGLIYVSTLLTGALPAGFRADIERIEVFKNLPISPWAIVAGQLFGPTIMLTAFHGFLFASLSVVLPQFWPQWLIGACISPLFNFMLLSISNGLFLFFPIQIANGESPDFQTGMKNMLMFMMQYLVLAVFLGVVAAVTAIVFYWTKNEPLAATVASIVLAGECVLGLVLVWTAYTRFDVTKHMP